MRWEPSAAARLAGFLLLLCGGLALGSAAPAASARDLGALGPFYRATQLQGQLIGMGLIEIPAYLTAADVDLRYQPKPGMAQEIPFVDSFSIVRFLGGYRDDWLGTSTSAAARSITPSGGATALCSSGRN
ncbi:MAG TPA: hypothetical protein VGN21_17270 [Stellaceae bacterium]